MRRIITASTEFLKADPEAAPNRYAWAREGGFAWMAQGKGAGVTILILTIIIVSILSIIHNHQD